MGRYGWVYVWVSVWVWVSTYFKVGVWVCVCERERSGGERENHSPLLSARTFILLDRQCDQIWRFIGLWASF